MNECVSIYLTDTNTSKNVFSLALSHTFRIKASDTDWILKPKQVERRLNPKTTD